MNTILPYLIVTLFVVAAVILAILTMRLIWNPKEKPQGEDKSTSHTPRWHGKESYYEAQKKRKEK